MIPVKLSMRNFMCYRENVPPLYFDGIHTACISGDNGNGKSALVDAMTWALWGKARAKSDDDLIYQGQTEMGVEFDFAIGEQVYRIIRQRARPRRRQRAGQTILEFQVAAGDGFRSITGNTVHETEKKITDVLHMDYQTFINSAFLRQGHADEFTNKRPVERKEVLANILGLSVYDVLEDEAKNLAKQQEWELAQLERDLKDIDLELARKPDYEADFNRAQIELTRMEKLTGEQESRVNQLRQEKELVATRKSQLLQVEEQFSETKREIDQWDEQVRQRRSRIEEYEELIARRSVIEQGYAQFIEAKSLGDEFDQKLRQSVILSQRKHQLEMAIERAQAALITEHKVAQSRIEELEVKSQKLPQLQNEFRQAEAQLAQLSEQEETLRRKRQAHQELQAQISHLESGVARLKQEIVEVEGKLRMLLAQQEARCPLCESEIGLEALKLIENKYTAERQHKSDDLKSSQTELAGRRSEAESLVVEISRLEDGLNRARTSIQGKAGVLRREVDEAEAASGRLDEERKKLAGIERRLAGKDFAAAEQRALAELEAELDRLDYNSQQHDEARQRMAGLQQYENPRRRLEEADRLIGQEREAAFKAEEAVEQRRRSLEAQNQKLEGLNVELAALPQLEQLEIDLTQAEAGYRALAAEQKQAQETLWSVKARLERCSEMETKKREREKSLGQASAEERIYRDLAFAFGKKGVQGWLIETALPEVEAEANELLARMTDNRMHLRFETQRETKKGDLAETLDINISDELGARNYEMFSGGEAFRINFAIRIALSRLLARRAGAPLRTLIIDEGFGTQDSSGIERIKEAINSIQDDFDKILAITHMQELRDAFPTRIDVIKTGEGSTLEINS